MNEPNHASIGEQIDQLVAHLIESDGRRESDVSHNNAQIDKLQRSTWAPPIFWFGIVIGVTFVFGIVGIAAVAGRSF